MPLLCWIISGCPHKHSLLVSCRLPHVDFSPLVFKLHLVHCQLHQVDSASAPGPEIFDSPRIRNGIRSKPLPVILDDDGQSSSQFTPATNLDQPVRIRPVPLNHGIRHGFQERELDAWFMAEDAAR